MASSEGEKAPQQGQPQQPSLPKPVFHIGDVPFCFGDAKKFQSLKEASEMEFDASDVMMCGYMRSGTTWHRQILWLILNDANVEMAAKLSQFERILYIEKGWFMPGEKMPKETLKEMKSPRTLASHFPYQILGPQIKKAGMKAIYMMRNPKDIVTSSWYASRTFAPMIDPKYTQVPWELLLGYMCSENPEMGNMFNHMRSFWEHRDDPNILIMFYEESKNDHEGAVRKIAKFVGKDLSDEQVKTIVDFTSFQAMKETSVKDRKDTGFFKLTDEKFAFVRKGQIGDWKNHFTVAQNAFFDQYMAQKMKDMDIKFTFQ